MRDLLGYIATPMVKADNKDDEAHQCGDESCTRTMHVNEDAGLRGPTNTGLRITLQIKASLLE
jgi:hypothetical protein